MCNVYFIFILTPPWLQVKVTKYFDFGNLDVWRVAVCVRFSSETTRPISPMMIPINWENNGDVHHALHFDLDCMSRPQNTLILGIYNGPPKWPPAAILWNKLKKKVVYWSKMATNAIKVIFGHPKKIKLRIDLKWWEVIFGHPKWHALAILWKIKLCMTYLCTTWHVYFI